MMVKCVGGCWYRTVAEAIVQEKQKTINWIPCKVFIILCTNKWKKSIKISWDEKKKIPYQEVEPK